MNDLTADKLAIREVIENWVVYRDAGDWERFATVWHSDGWMTATWFQGPATDFIEVSRVLFDQGGNILHTLAGHVSLPVIGRSHRSRCPFSNAPFLTISRWM